MSRPKKPADAPAPARRVWRPVLAIVVTLAAVAGVVYGLGRLGDEALRRVAGRARYHTPFADITCDAPPGLDRPTFLAEVRYVAALPETVHALDPIERDRLVAGFGKHPWVEAVGAVTAVPGGGVRVELRFRTPVLAVTTADGTPRQLDRHGVLLPVAPSPTGVAELAGVVPAPSVSTGEVWQGGDVARAVELVNAYHPQRLEVTTKGWRLTMTDGRVMAVER